MKRILFALAFCSSFAHAAVEVSDPQNVLKDLDAALGTPSWSESFRQGDQAHYTKQLKECTFSCQDDGFFSGCSRICEQVNLPYSRSVASCDAESLRIFSDEGEDLEFSRTEFEALKGNMTKQFLAQLDEVIPAVDKVNIEAFVPASYKLAANTPKERIVSAFNLTGTVRLKEFPTHTLSLLVTVGKDVAGVGQVLRLRVDDATFFRALDIEKAGE